MTITPVMQALFDGLMEQIEPDLMIIRREEIAKELAAMSPTKRTKVLQSYGEKYAQFLEQWPGYLHRMLTIFEDFIQGMELEKAAKNVDVLPPNIS